MAQSLDFILRAKDEATGAIRRVAGEVGGLQGTIGKLSASAGAIGIVVGALGTAATAAVAFGKRMADTVESLDRVAGATGVSIGQVQILRRVFDDAGVSTEKADKALQFMGKAIGENNPLLARLGITSRNSYEALLQLSDAFRTNTDSAAKQAIAQKLLSEAGGEVAGVFNTLREQTDRMGQRMTAAGAIIGDETAEQARKLDRAMTDLSVQWEGFSNTLFSMAVPAATAIIGKLNEMWEATQRIGESDWWKALQKSVEWLQKDKKAWEDDAEAMGKWLEARNKALKAGEKPPPEPGPFGGFGGSGRSRGGGGGVFETGGGAGGGGGGGGGGLTETPREKAIKAITESMRVSAQVATFLYERLEAVEGRRRAAKTLEGALGVELDTQLPDIRKIGRQPLPGLEPDQPTQEDVDQWSDARQKQDELLASSQRVNEVLLEQRIKWTEVVESYTSGAAIAAQGLEALWSGLQSGFGQVFANLTNKAQTFKSAMKTIFNSLVQEVLAMLARIVAAKVFAFILNLILPGAGTVAGGIIAGGKSAQRVNPGAASVRTASPGNGTVINVYGLDSRDVAAALTSPTGSLRNAMEQAALAGAY